MKIKYAAFILSALILASCVTTETTFTTPDGATTVTKQTTLSGLDVATGLVGIGSAVKTVTDEK